MRAILSKLACLTVLLFIFAFVFIRVDPVSSAATHIVISQVSIAGTTVDDEFVEIYNPTNANVDLTGWKLTRKNSAGTEGTLVASLSGTILPKSYFLIGSAVYVGSVLKDLSYSNNSNNLTNNYSVLIYDKASTVVDKVGFGSLSKDFESTAAANPTVGGSIQRKIDDTGGHGMDTDNNLNDLELVSVATPRNSQIIITPTNTPANTPTNTPSPTPTDTPTPTPTETPTPTLTPTPTSTPSLTPTPTITPSFAPTASPTLPATQSGITVPKFRIQCFNEPIILDFVIFKITIPMRMCRLV